MLAMHHLLPVFAILESSSTTDRHHGLFSRLARKIRADLNLKCGMEVSETTKEIYDAFYHQLYDCTTVLQLFLAFTKTQNRFLSRKVKGHFTQFTAFTSLLHRHHAFT